MKNSVLLLLILFISCNSNIKETKKNGRIENGVYFCDRFDWEIKIPQGYKIETINDVQKKEDLGYEKIKNTSEGIEVRKNRPHLIGFKHDNKNTFSASFEPLEGTKKMTLPEHQKFIAKIVADSYKTIEGIEFSQKLDVKKIGDYKFYIIRGEVFNQKTNKLILTQLIYNTYIKNHLFSISINYTNEEVRDILINNFEESLK